MIYNTLSQMTLNLAIVSEENFPIGVKLVISYQRQFRIRSPRLEIKMVCPSFLFRSLVFDQGLSFVGPLLETPNQNDQSFYGIKNIYVVPCPNALNFNLPIFLSVHPKIILGN
jgi:hypothetical protein